MDIFHPGVVFLFVIYMTILSSFHDSFAQHTGPFFKERLLVSTSRDSVHSKKKSPKAAMIKTALVPGWGQWYNEQYIKAVLVFGVRSFFIGQAIHNQIRKNNSVSDLERERFGTKRNDAIVYYVIATLISMVDAYIDAHLFDFDTGPDLAMRMGLQSYDSNLSEQPPLLKLSLRATF